jgi:hypothetical protein
MIATDHNSLPEPRNVSPAKDIFLGLQIRCLVLYWRQRKTFYVDVSGTTAHAEDYKTTMIRESAIVVGAG